MIVIQCFAENDRQFKGDIAEPGTERNKLFLKRMFPFDLCFVSSYIEDLLMLSGSEES